MICSSKIALTTYLLELFFVLFGVVVVAYILITSIYRNVCGLGVCVSV